MDISKETIWKKDYSDERRQDALLFIKEAKLFSKQAQAKKEDKDQPSTGRRIAGTGIGAGVGTAALKSSVPDLTGRTNIYHGTRGGSAEQIRQSGLYSRQQRGVGDADSLTAAVTDPKVNDASKNLVFATSNKSRANIYAMQNRMAEELAAAEGIPFNDAMRRVMSGEGLQKLPSITAAGNVNLQAALYQLPGDFLKNKADLDNTVRFNVPLWKLREQGMLVDNPEIQGIMDSPFQAVIEKAMMGEDKFRRNLENTLGERGGSYTITDGLGTEYLPGHDDYKKLSLSELGEYIKKNKGQFAKGVGKAGVGIGAGYLGLKSLLGNRKTEQEKTAMRGKLITGATGLGALALGGNEYLKSKANPNTGLTRREAARQARQAQDDAYASLTGKKRNALVRKLEGLSESAGQKMDERRDIAVPAMAVTGGLIGGLSAKKALDFVKANARNL